MTADTRRELIPFDVFGLRVVHGWANQWMLLAAGERPPGAFNVMTVAWGAFGVMWSKPMALVVVRPSRYTYQFMEQGSSFTLSMFPGEFKGQLTLCGTRSGRSFDKLRASGFTPIPSTAVEAPGFDEAELIVECRKMYFDDIEPAHFLLPEIEGNYNGRDYHRMYWGEIAAIHGTREYRLNRPKGA
jgi:flavin reductase (DIM6/NTAB) family NADH-FMN oxidoreductase RutF